MKRLSKKAFSYVAYYQPDKGSQLTDAQEIKIPCQWKGNSTGMEFLFLAYVLRITCRSIFSLNKKNDNNPQPKPLSKPSVPFPCPSIRKIEKRPQTSTGESLPSPSDTTTKAAFPEKAAS